MGARPAWIRRRSARCGPDVARIGWAGHRSRDVRSPVVGVGATGRAHAMAKATSKRRRLCPLIRSAEARPQPGLRPCELPFGVARGAFAPVAVLGSNPAVASVRDELHAGRAPRAARPAPTSPLTASHPARTILHTTPRLHAGWAALMAASFISAPTHDHLRRRPRIGARAPARFLLTHRTDTAHSAVIRFPSA